MLIYKNMHNLSLHFLIINFNRTTHHYFMKSPVFNFRFALQTLAIGLLCITNLSSKGQISEIHYKIYSVKAEKEVSLSQIATDMQNSDVLFFGEEHNDSVSHFLEQKMFEAMHAQYGSKTVLSVEMFDRDVQVVMNEYLKDAIREKNFKRDARVWSNYGDYRPMIEFSKTHNLHVICANAPSRYTNLAGRKGQAALKDLSEQSKKFFAPLPYSIASGAYYNKLVQLTSHEPPSATDTSAKTVVPMASMGGFDLITAQSLWDATMAYSIAEYIKKNKGKKVLQVNGRFHSDEKFAIVTQLKNYNPKLKSLVISAGSDESFPSIDWNKFKHLGDYIIITDPTVPKTYEE